MFGHEPSAASLENSYLNKFFAQRLCAVGLGASLYTISFFYVVISLLGPLNQEYLFIFFVSYLSWIYALVSIVAFLNNRSELFRVNLVARLEYFSAKGVLITCSVFIAVYQNIDVLIASVVLGQQKEEFISSMNPSYVYLFLYRVSMILLAYQLVFKKFNVATLALVCYLAFVLLIQVRSILVFFLQSAIILYLIFDSRVISKQKVFLAVCVFVLAGATTLLQGREASVLDGFFAVFETFARFQIFGMYLSDYIYNLKTETASYLFPFCGIACEKLMIYVGFVELPIAAGTDFIGSFKHIGVRATANSIYPWYAWYWHYFGWFTLLVWPIFMFCIVFICWAFRLYLTVFYLVLIIIFIALWRHPFLNTTDMFGFLGVLGCDLFFNFRGWIIRMQRNKFLRSN